MIDKIKYRFRVLKVLIPYGDGVKRFFALSFLFSICSTALGLLTPVVYKNFIDKVILGGKFGVMPKIVGAYLAIYLAGVVIGYLKNIVGYKLNNTVTYRAKRKIWNSFFRMPFSKYETTSVGEMKMRLDDDTSQINTFMSGQSIGYIVSLVNLIVSGVILVVIDVRLAIFSVLLIPLTFVIDGKLSRREGVLNESNRQNDENMSSWIHASVQGWREVRALGLEKKQERSFVRYLHNYALYFGKWINYWTFRVLVMPKIKNEFLMKFGLYFFGGLLIIYGKLTIGSLLVFASYYGTLSGSVAAVSGADAELQSNKPFSDRLIESLSSEPEGNAGCGEVPDMSNTIKFENVCFSYSAEKGEIIHDLDLIVNRGERVAITGKSGVGKTTILKLICGMIEPTAGKVTFSGIDLRDIDLSSMHSRIGFVMQENILFNTTIRENLLYSRKNATNEELFSALEKAYILDFVKSLPDGLDTVIGERGIKLSGGQRQRIVLARLFLRDVDIFIFDEATSALDQYSENIIHDAIKNIAEDKTIIIVAHRESSIRLCERRIEIA